MDDLDDGAKEQGLEVECGKPGFECLDKVGMIGWRLWLEAICKDHPQEHM